MSLRRLRKNVFATICFESLEESTPRLVVGYAFTKFDFNLIGRKKNQRTHQLHPICDE